MPYLSMSAQLKATASKAEGLNFSASVLAGAFAPGSCPPANSHQWYTIGTPVVHQWYTSGTLVVHPFIITLNPIPALMFHGCWKLTPCCACASEPVHSKQSCGFIKLCTHVACKT